MMNALNTLANMLQAKMHTLQETDTDIFITNARTTKSNAVYVNNIFIPYRTITLTPPRSICLYVTVPAVVPASEPDVLGTVDGVALIAGIYADYKKAQEASKKLGEETAMTGYHCCCCSAVTLRIDPS